jgi:hypothetical protein
VLADATLGNGSSRGGGRSVSSLETGQEPNPLFFLVGVGDAHKLPTCPYSALNPWAGGASDSLAIHPAREFGTGSTEPPSGTFPRTVPRQRRQPMSKSRHRSGLGTSAALWTSLRMCSAQQQPPRQRLGRGRHPSTALCHPHGTKPSVV